LPTGSSLIATEVASPFLTPLKFAFYLALFVSIPFLIYQLIKFASPGLYFEEKIYFFPLVLGSILLFYLGITFAYFIILPIVFSFFSASTPENVMMMTDINLLLSFVIKMFFAFGLAFEMPIIIILLLVSNAVTVSKLISARPYVFLGCFVVGMLLTPPDVISQSLLAIPAWLLYELGIIVGRMLIRNKQ
jgi:sec-independent protein translocase protein TatC